MSDAPRVPAKPRPATRADVARYAGVSTAVVSYVINEGPRRVAPETAARVRAAIEILKYRPNVNARALKKGFTEMLGVVLPDITNPFFAEYARALEIAAAAHGYVLVVATSDGNEAQESRILSDLANRHVDGLIIATVLPPSGFRAITAGRPTVLINCSTPFRGYPAVGPASREGARALIDHLITVHGLDHGRVERADPRTSRARVGRRFPGLRAAARPHRSDQLQSPGRLRGRGATPKLGDSAKRDLCRLRSNVHRRAEGYSRSRIAVPGRHCRRVFRRHVRG
jgi:DNA-binding LacI/PurR family transcriptional regulator